MTEVEGIDNSRDLQHEIRDLTARDWQLWSIGLLVLLIIVVGFVTLGLPGLLWHGEKVPTVQVHFLPQLVSGLIVLIVLLNVYLIGQKKRLDKVRDGLLRDLILRSSGENSPIMDRLTKVFGPDYVDAALEREIARANRLKAPITLGLFDIVGTGAVNHTFGILSGDYLLLVAGQTLKKTFRGSDTVCRFQGDQFLVILPDTSEQQAKFAFARLRSAVDLWNRNSEVGYTLSFHLGATTYVSGINPKDLIPRAKAALNEAKVRAHNSDKTSSEEDIASVVPPTYAPKLVSRA